MNLIDPFIAGFLGGATVQVFESIRRWRDRPKKRSAKPADAFLVAPWQQGGWVPPSDNVSDSAEWGGGDRWSGRA